jgi:hypothetical protein
MYGQGDCCIFFAKCKLTKVFFHFVSDEVGVIDEIQMVRDSARGWAWTRTVLGQKFVKFFEEIFSRKFTIFSQLCSSYSGMCVDELHICGEGSAIELVKEMLLDTGDEMEVKTYKRLTTLRIQDQPLRRISSFFLFSFTIFHMFSFIFIRDL